MRSRRDMSFCDLFRSLGGGEIVEYRRLVEDTRRHAVDRYVKRLWNRALIERIEIKGGQP